MLTLWVGGALMLLVALAMLLPTLFGASGGRRGTTRAAPPDLNVQIYRERLATLEAQAGAGEVSVEESARARAELDRELLADTGAEAAADRDSRIGPGGLRRARALLGIAVALALPAGAIALYWHLGPGETLSAIASGEALRAPAAEPAAADVEAMVAGLADRLEREPRDTEGWMMLARSYQVLERSSEALDAYARALETAPDDPNVLVAFAELESIAAGHRLGGPPREKIEHALDIDPDHEKALWLGALAALQEGENPLAQARFATLLARQPPASEQAAALRKLMANAGLEAPAADTASAPRLRVNVRIAPELAARLSGEEPLFVFARETNGPPMPLAAARRATRELPLTVELGDADAMTPERTLSRASDWAVGARVAIGGDARKSPGDLEATTISVEASEETVTVDLVIDTIAE